MGNFIIFFVLFIFAYRLGKLHGIEKGVKAIKQEPEFPGEMPDYLYKDMQRLCQNKDRVEKYLRYVVRLTKDGIYNRLIFNSRDVSLSK